MGLGVLKNGQHQPITPSKGSWAESVRKSAQQPVTKDRRNKP
jgi:hypothetical protein